MDGLDDLLGGMDPARRHRYELTQRMQKRYFSSRRDKTLSNEINRWVDVTLASLVGPHPEGRILAVIGDPGAGKTRAIKRAMSAVPALGQSTLCVIAPRPCTLKQLGRTFLSAMGYELHRDLREHLTWEKVRDHLEANQVRFVWVDEFQHVLDGKHDAQVAAISDTFKNLVQRRSWPVSFLLSGLPAVSSFLGRDRQLERRSRTLEFGCLSFPASTGLIREVLLNTIVETDGGMGLGDLATDEFVHRLCHATGGALGVVIDLIRSAVLEAAERSTFNGIIQMCDFAAAYASERGCEPSENIFLSSRWHEIRPENSRLRPPVSAEER
ncbi:ATP-binding protein [Caenispirillum bisanense]|uniref:ATP-binding protein n=1 Tax=Caenispirillum bisanense TaxID=414052 RepID=UPI0031DE3F93